jgi:serine protease Do
MRFPSLTKRHSMVLLGIVLIALGGVGLLLAQRQPVRQVIRIGFDGAYLGIEMEDVTADNVARYKLSGEAGVIVRSVEKGSPAETARLQENDVILEYAGMPVFSSAALSRMVQESPVNRNIILGVSREGKKLNLTVKLGERSGIRTPAVPLNNAVPDLRRFDFNGGLFQFDVPRGGSRILRVVPSRPQLGVTAESLTEQMGAFLGASGKKGVLVNTVNAGSPAAAVLKAGDIILSIDGKPVAEPTELTQELLKKEPGSKAELKIFRDRKEMTVSVEFPRSPSQRGIIL